MWHELTSLTGIALGTAAAASVALVPRVRRCILPPPFETYLSDTLPFHYMLDDQTTLVCKDGSLVQTLELKGIDYSTKTEEEINSLRARRHYWLHHLAEEGQSLTLLTVRTKTSPSQNTQTFGHPVLQHIHQRLEGSQESFRNRYYLMLKETPSQRRGPFSLSLGKVTERARTTLEALHEYQPRLLSLNSSLEEPSSLSSLWTLLVNGQTLDLTLNPTHLADHLAATTVSFHPKTGLITYLDGDQLLYSRVISLKVWGQESREEWMKKLLQIPCEMVILQTLQGIPKVRILPLLDHQKKQARLFFFNPKIEADFETVQQLIHGDEAGFFKYQLSIFLTASTLEELDHHTATLRQGMADYGMRPSIEGGASEWLWYMRLPSFIQMIRPTHLLSFNVAHLNPFEYHPQGLTHCDWGPGALRSFKTASGSSYAFQLHISDQPEALAHSVVIAPAGSGKTTFFQHLIGGALRHQNLRAYIFDRFAGTKIFTHAIDGLYLDLGNQQALPLNPLQMDDTPSNRDFIQQFLLQLAGLDEAKSREIAGRAVELLFKLPKEQRVLANVHTALFDHGSTLKKHLHPWAHTTLARWFNGVYDGLDLDQARLVTFEMSDVQQNPHVAAAMTTYLMYRIRSLVRRDALPHLIFIDETAPLLQDALFAQEVQQLFREHRKLRGSINVCFQDASSLQKSGFMDTILNQCQTQILFPNENATREDYQPFNLTEAQWDFIKGQSPLNRPLKHGVLIKRPGEAVILEVDLSGLGSHLKLYRSGSEPVKIMQHLKTHWGAKWIEPYLETDL